MTSAMLGLNQSVRKTPVRSSTTKLHSAISPSMKDQWSGKTFLICFFAMVASPRRSSAQVAAPPILLGFSALAACLPFVAIAINGHHVPSSWGRPAPRSR